MPKLGRLTPCAECPWLRKSRRGYLGADNPESFYRSAVTNEGQHPCHIQIDYADPNWETDQLPHVDLCAGNLIHFNNTMKRPRNPELAAAVDLVGKSPHVFDWPTEFMAHHMPTATPEHIALAASRAMWPFPNNE